MFNQIKATAKTVKAMYPDMIEAYLTAYDISEQDREMLRWMYKTKAGAANMILQLIAEVIAYRSVRKHGGSRKLGLVAMQAVCIPIQLGFFGKDGYMALLRLQKAVLLQRFNQEPVEPEHEDSYFEEMLGDYDVNPHQVQEVRGYCMVCEAQTCEQLPDHLIQEWDEYMEWESGKLTFREATTDDLDQLIKMITQGQFEFMAGDPETAVEELEKQKTQAKYQGYVDAFKQMQPLKDPEDVGLDIFESPDADSAQRDPKDQLLWEHKGCYSLQRQGYGASTCLEDLGTLCPNFVDYETAEDGK